MISMERWIGLYRYPIINRFAQIMVMRKGADIPCSVLFEGKCYLPHNALGTVIHPNTVIEDQVKLYQNVTIGRGDVWRPYDQTSQLMFQICEGAILCAGCKVLCSKGKLVVGRHAVVAANAVVTRSVGDYEIWAGVPARRIGMVSKD